MYGCHRICILIKRWIYDSIQYNILKIFKLEGSKVMSSIANGEGWDVRPAHVDLGRTK